MCKLGGYVDKTGKMVVPCKYDYAQSFYEGLAVVELNDKYGYIDKQAKKLSHANMMMLIIFPKGLLL
jgi:hypothetical protein